MNAQERLAQEAKDKISVGFHTAKDKTEELTGKMKKTASNLMEEGKSQYSKLEDTVGEYTDEFIQTIKDKPVKSVLIASGIGFLLAKIFKH